MNTAAQRAPSDQHGGQHHGVPQQRPLPYCVPSQSGCRGNVQQEQQQQQQQQQRPRFSMSAKVKGAVRDLRASVKSAKTAARAAFVAARKRRKNHERRDRKKVQLQCSQSAKCNSGLCDGSGNSCGTGVGTGGGTGGGTGVGGTGVGTGVGGMACGGGTKKRTRTTPSYGGAPETGNGGGSMYFGSDQADHGWGGGLLSDSAACNATAAAVAAAAAAAPVLCGLRQACEEVHALVVRVKLALQTMRANHNPHKMQPVLERHVRSAHKVLCQCAQVLEEPGGGGGATVAVAAAAKAAAEAASQHGSNEVRAVRKQLGKLKEAVGPCPVPLEWRHAELRRALERAHCRMAAVAGAARAAILASPAAHVAAAAAAKASVPDAAKPTIDAAATAAAGAWMAAAAAAAAAARRAAWALKAVLDSHSVRSAGRESGCAGCNPWGKRSRAPATKEWNGWPALGAERLCNGVRTWEPVGGFHKDDKPHTPFGPVNMPVALIPHHIREELGLLGFTGFVDVDALSVRQIVAHRFFEIGPGQEGLKTIEARSKALRKSLVGQWLCIRQSGPGARSKVIGFVKFGASTLLGTLSLKELASDARVAVSLGELFDMEI